MKKILILLFLLAFLSFVARCSVVSENDDEYNCEIYTGFEQEMCIADEAFNQYVLDSLQETWTDLSRQ